MSPGSSTESYPAFARNPRKPQPDPLQPMFNVIVNDAWCLVSGCIEIKTLGHVLGACPYGETLRIYRHHAKLADALRKLKYTVYEEVHGTADNDSNRRIDIIAISESLSRAPMITNQTQCNSANNVIVCFLRTPTKEPKWYILIYFYYRYNESDFTECILLSFSQFIFSLQQPDATGGRAIHPGNANNVPMTVLLMIRFFSGAVVCTLSIGDLRLPLIDAAQVVYVLRRRHTFSAEHSFNRISPYAPVVLELYAFQLRFAPNHRIPPLFPVPLTIVPEITGGELYS
ncbi:hypothetical protein ANN_11141 [Periplaneta americana]|uniref:Uncharacterized protein n=1 Tax=Periplaneta americana TaxID=6978 RepID=A0ABQ8T5V4_PERAM|nr:hypothetical protein ANN_11141 [Periplaneta americana]